MKVANVMLGKGIGGIEQVFCDYTNILKQEGIEHISIMDKNASIKPKIKGETFTVTCNSTYDIFTIFKLKKFLQANKIDIIITHGGRANTIMYYANAFYKAKIITLTHNYKHQRLLKADYIIAITKNLQEYFIAKGKDPKKVFLVNNMTKTKFKPDFVEVNYGDIVTIGVLARLVPEKGIETFLEAIKILKNQNVNIRAIIGGDGPLMHDLQHYSSILDIHNIVTFEGWVLNKKVFYKNIDVLCMPSHHEPFGLVLLEGFLHSKPICASSAEGPREIITHMHNGMLSKISDPKALAADLKTVIENPSLANNLIKSGYQDLHKYSEDFIGKQVLDVLEYVYKHR